MEASVFQRSDRGARVERKTLSARFGDLFTGDPLIAPVSGPLTSREGDQITITIAVSDQELACVVEERRAPPKVSRLDPLTHPLLVLSKLCKVDAFAGEIDRTPAWAVLANDASSGLPRGDLRVAPSSSNLSFEVDSLATNATI